MRNMENNSLHLIDNKLKEITGSILKDGADANWPQCKQGLQELAYMVSRKGLTFQDFEQLRKDLIQAIEIFQPLAKTHIEQEERRNATIH
jgi:hypothetical protein